MSGTRRVAVVLLALGLLLAVVVVAAGGEPPVGGRGDRRPSEWMLDIVVSLLLVLLAVGAVLLIVLLVLLPRELVDPKSGRPRKRGRGALVGLLAFVLVFLAARSVITGDGNGLTSLFGQGAIRDPTDGAGDQYQPQFATVPVLAITALFAVAICAWLVGTRPRRGVAQSDERLQAALADALDDSLDDLRAERDPRQAVIAAYARLERVLAAHGVPRHPSEAAEEYLRRVLSSLDLSRRAVSRLTALFQTARFSHHDVDAGMKREAIDALVSARDELRAARERAEEERRAARERAAERA